MKHLFAVATCVLALGMSAPRAEALVLTFESAQYLGSAVPGLPSGDSFEEAMVTKLTTMAPGASSSCGAGGLSDDTCTRSSNTFGPLPTPVEIVSPKITGTNSVEVTGINYILAKYGSGSTGNNSRVWYVGGLSLAPGELVYVPSESGGGLSHISRFNTTGEYDPPPSVPDGGTTVMLLGSALLALGAVRKRLSL